MNKIFGLFLSVLMLIGVMAVGISEAGAKSVGAPSAVKLKSKSAGFKVSFKRSSGSVSGYKIKYSVNRSFSGSKTVKILAPKSSKSIGGLKDGKKYYVKVCAYSGSSTSKWTGAKSVKTKYSSKTMKSYLRKGCWVTYYSDSKTGFVDYFTNKTVGAGYKRAKSYSYYVKNGKFIKENSSYQAYGYKVNKDNVACYSNGVASNFYYTTNKNKVAFASFNGYTIKKIHFNSVPSYSKLKKYF